MIETPVLINEIGNAMARIREDVAHPDMLVEGISVDYVYPGCSDCSEYTPEMGPYVAVYLNGYGLETDIFLNSGQVRYNMAILKTLPTVAAV